MINEIALTITMLIFAQSSNSFQARNDANQLLQQLAPFTELHLLHFQDHSTDLETRWKCHQNLTLIEESLVVNALWDKEYPYVDMLPTDFTNRTVIIRHWLDAVPKSNGPNWPQYRAATKSWIFYLYRTGTPTYEIKYLLTRMEENEIRWRQNNPR